MTTTTTTKFQPGDRVKVLHPQTREIVAKGTIQAGVGPTASTALIQYDSFASIGGVHSVERADLVLIIDR